MKVEFVADTGAAEIVALLVHEGRVFSGDTAGYDTASSGALTKAMKASRFTGGALSHLAVAAPAGVDAGQVLLVGAGDEAKLDDQAIEKAAAQAYSAVKMSGAEALTLDLKHLSAEQAARAAFGAVLGAYRFDKYRTTLKPEKIPSIKTVRVVAADPKAAEAAFEPMSAVADAVMFARDLVSEPATVL